MKNLWIVLSLLSLPVWLDAKIIEGIAAKVDGSIITISELEASKQALSGFFKDNEKTRKLLDHLIDLELILNEAKRSGIKVSSQEIEDVLNEIKANFKTEEEFKEALVRQGYTIEDLRSDYEEELLRRRLINKEIRSKIQITPKELTDIRNRLSIQLHAKHILVRTREEAEEILKRLKDGVSFEDLAKEYSICPSKEKGGDLGFFVKGEMVKEFDEAAFGLKDGKISEIVKTKYGYHIIKAIESRSTPKEELERLEEIESSRLFEEKFEQELGEWLKRLRKKAYIEVMF